MRKRVNLMCSLALAAGLVSCAPSMQNGQAARIPDIVVGVDAVMVPRIPLELLTDQTPPATYVVLPDCGFAVVSVPVVRRLGVPAATKFCNETATSRTTFTVVSTVFVSILAYYLGQLFAKALFGPGI